MFPGVQQLDLTGPHDVLASLPDAAVHLVWKSRDTVASSSGLALAPTCTFDDCPPLDVICVPGGIGINELLLDAQTIAFRSFSVKRLSMQKWVGKLPTTVF